MIIFNIILLIILAIIALQDIATREVSGYLFALAFVVIVARSLYMESVSDLLRYFGLNFLLVILQLSLLYLYYAIKNRKFTNIFNNNLGAGDLFFLICLCTSFSPLVYGFYLVASFILIIFLYLIITIFKGNKTIQTIPLAGGLAVTYMVLLVLEVFYKGIDLYNDTLIGDLIIGR